RELHLHPRDLAPDRFHFGARALGIEQQLRARLAAGALARDLRLQLELPRGGRIPALDKGLLLRAPRLTLVHAVLAETKKPGIPGFAGMRPLARPPLGADSPSLIQDIRPPRGENRSPGVEPAFPALLFPFDIALVDVLSAVALQDCTRPLRGGRLVGRHR